MLDTNAIIQGIIAALVPLAVIVFYLDRMSSVSQNLESISNSMKDVHGDLQSVDLKDMEKTTNKLETFLDAELQNRFTGRQNVVTGGQNSVVHRLNDLDIDVTVSYVGDPDWHAGLRNHEEWDGEETIFNIEFDEEVDTQGLVGLLSQSGHLEKVEQQLFDAEFPSRMRADSPFQVSVAVPTSDLKEVSVWISEMLDEVESDIQQMRKLRRDFDENVADELGGSSEII